MNDLFGEVCQIGIVVSELETVLEHYLKLFNLDEININYVDTEKGIGQDFTLHGKSVEVKARIAWFIKGSVEIEIIEPLNDTSIYAEFLKKHGPGIHHIMFTTSSYRDTERKLTEYNCSSIASGKMQNVSFQIFDTVKQMGFYSELADGDPLEADEVLTQKFPGDS